MDTDLIILKHFIERRPSRAAQLLERLGDAEAAAFLDEIPVELAVRLISLMNSYKAAKCLELIHPHRAAELLVKTDIRIAASMLRQADERFRGEILSRISKEHSTALHQRLEYPPHSIGALMVPLTFVLRKDMLVKDAIGLLKDKKDQISTNIYVVDEELKLAGVAHLNELLFAEKTHPIAALVKTETPTFFAEMPIEAVKNHPAWDDNHSVPVVDSAGKLVGVLNFAETRKNDTKPDQEMTKHVIETSNALGELYRISLTGFLQSISTMK